jgi:hypothetical protein
MQPEFDQTATQHTRPDADKAHPSSDRAQTGAATGAADTSGPDVDLATEARRVTVQEAADALGITVEAVRARIRRGTLTKEKAPDGSVYVLLTTDQAQQSNDRSATFDPREDARVSGVSREGDRTNDRSRSDDALVDTLREQIALLRSDIEDRKEEARRKDAIIMSLCQRFPELPLASAPESPGTAATESQEEGSPAGSQEAPRQRSWFMRFFFGP